jgi:hypothetical protein
MKGAGSECAAELGRDERPDVLKIPMMSAVLESPVWFDFHGPWEFGH